LSVSLFIIHPYQRANPASLLTLFHPYHQDIYYKKEKWGPPNKKRKGGKKQKTLEARGTGRHATASEVLQTIES
jgi:hypothetical protein